MDAVIGGCNMETLADYLKEHKPTEAQLDYINSIEFNSDHRFTGKTKQEAQKFISKYAYCCHKTHYTQKQNYNSFNIEEKSDIRVGPYGERTIYRLERGPYGAYELVADDEGDGDAYGW